MVFRKFLIMSALVLWGTLTYGAKEPSRAHRSTKAVEIEYTIGNPNAPVTFYEYGSLTCHVCSNFYKNVLPKIQKDFPEIQIIVRLMSFDKIDMAAAKMILHSKDPHGLSLAFYKAQNQWMEAPDQLEALKKIALDFGMTEEEINTSQQDKSLGHSLLSRRLILKAKSAPLFRVGKSLLPGLPDYEKYLKPLLRQAVDYSKKGNILEYDVLQEMVDAEKAKEEKEKS